ncbi:MAG: DUF932 domain-containing protein [Candidatus Nanopelagicales bacterium]
MTTALTRPRHRLPASAVLGTDIAAATNVDEALQLASLGWGIQVRDAGSFTVMTKDGVTSTSMPGQRFLMRSDNQVTLAAVGSRYEPIDNRAAFGLADHARQMGATFAHAGESDHGRKVFLTMDLPGARVHVGGKDIVDFGVVFWAHHGSGSVSGSVTGKRLICMNGATIGIGVPIKWTILHTASAHDRLVLAETSLKGATRYAKEFAAVGEMLISTPFTENQFGVYIDRLYPRPDEGKKSALTRWETRRSELFELFRTAETQADSRDTQWAAFNAVTEWEDWFRSTRGSDGAEQARAARQFTNADSAGVKQYAYETLLAA